LSAFAHLLGVLVRTLPHVLLAGIIALGGAWVVNHLDNSWVIRMPTWLQASQQSSPPEKSGSLPERNGAPENRQGSPAAGQQGSSPQNSPQEHPAQPQEHLAQ
jgi:hypothetical protein